MRIFRVPFITVSAATLEAAGPSQPARQAPPQLARQAPPQPARQATPQPAGQAPTQPARQTPPQAQPVPAHLVPAPAAADRKSNMLKVSIKSCSVASMSSDNRNKFFGLMIYMCLNRKPNLAAKFWPSIGPRMKFTN